MKVILHCSDACTVEVSLPCDNCTKIWVPKIIIDNKANKIIFILKKILNRCYGHMRMSDRGHPIFWTTYLLLPMVPNSKYCIILIGMKSWINCFVLFSLQFSGSTTILMFSFPMHWLRFIFYIISQYNWNIIVLLQN